MRQPLQRVARTLKLCDFRVERPNPCASKISNAGAVIARIQIEKFLDLLQSEARRLRLPDEPEPAYIVRAVTPDSFIASWSAEEAAALVKPDRFNTDAADTGELSNGQRLDSLTLYHGTEAIR